VHAEDNGTTLAHGLEGGLHVLHRGSPQICAVGVQGVQEAGPDALVGALGVGGAVGMALEPDRQQIGVGTRVGVQRRQPIDLGTEHFGLCRKDEFLSSVPVM
jgi:hypothetical protein